MSPADWIDVESELKELEKSLREWLDTAPSFVAPASRWALERLQLRRRQTSNWTRQFSPLVTLFPLLHAEVLGPTWLPQARRATLAHLLLLIHTFLEDRYLDGELAAHRHELLFAKLAQTHAVDLLLGLGPPAPLWREIHRATTEHAAAQAEPYHPTDDDQVFRVVAGRAAIGRVAALCLLIAAELPQDRLELARQAYDELVVGLQWEDDLKDLDQDRRSGSENLVLRLRGRSAPPALGDPSQDVPPTGVHDIEAGFSQLSRTLEGSLGRYRRIGAHALSRVLKERVESLGPWRRRVLERVATGQ